ncbi:hypothetical protein [Geodermatophilus sp. DSM 44513]|uniref:SPW repeat domain-containing protein n=1 Tax=Geodermatophilus sp. DSM 44513 TaxID=1528104 RepID=UPI001413333C|nr:hypothetical protein [Geodermatophilus sp. DSM 44513]WNV75258.1 hypothetical protein RTG05_20080 [Geodermatophilus sp. DSM 44513]
MLREGPIPQALQGLLEYLVGVLFVAAPFLFGFTDEGLATAASIASGVVFLVIAATSESPTGLVKQLPPAVHVLFDVVLALLLIVTPFVLGFSGVAVPRNLFLISGVVWLLVTIGSRYGKKPLPTAAPVSTAQPESARGQAAGQSPLGPRAAAPSTSPSSIGSSTVGLSSAAPRADRPPTGPSTPREASTRAGTDGSKPGPLDGGQRPR